MGLALESPWANKGAQYILQTESQAQKHKKYAFLFYPLSSLLFFKQRSDLREVMVSAYVSCDVRFT